MEARTAVPAGITAKPWFRTAAAIFFVFLWGSAFVPSKIGVLDSSPLWFLVARFLAAGVIALGIALATGAAWPQGKSGWAEVVLLGVSTNAMYLGFTYEALRHLAAGVGAIISSTNPLILALVAPWLLRERVSPLKAFGLLLGFGGVVLTMLARTGSGTAQPGDVALALAGVIASVASTIVFKKFLGHADLRMTTALQLLSAGIVLVPIAILTEGAPHAVWGAPLVWSFVWTVLVMSVGATFIWFWLLEKGEASRVTAFYFLSPVFGLAVASLFGEALTLRDLGCLVAIAAGIAIVQRS